jgi:hypothetical protein
LFTLPHDRPSTLEVVVVLGFEQLIHRLRELILVDLLAVLGEVRLFDVVTGELPSLTLDGISDNPRRTCLTDAELVLLGILVELVLERRVARPSTRRRWPHS